MFDTKLYEKKMNSAFDHFIEELKKVRTGRAHPGMLESVEVEVYGVRMPINQTANVNAPEGQLLVVTPFDPSNIPAISAAIRNNQALGFNPSDDGRIIRVPVPPLTEDRRRQMVKLVSEKVEEVRIALRNVRQEALKDAKGMKETKDISEDEYKFIEKEIDKLMSDQQKQIDESFQTKEKEILTV